MVLMPSALAAQPSAWRLGDAVQRALRVSPDLRGERAQRDVALAQRRAAVARQRPVLSTSLGVQRNPQLNATILPAEVFGGSGAPQVVRLGTPYESIVTRTLSVPLFDAAQRASVREGDAAVRVAEASAQQMREEIVLAVTTAYADVLVRHHELEAARTTVQTRQQQRISGERALETGRITPQQLEALRLAEERARTNEAKAMLAWTAARSALADQLSVPGDSVDSERLQLSDSLHAMAADVLRADSLTTRTGDTRLATGQLLRARADEDAAAAARTREKRSGWPTLRLVGTASTVAFSRGLRDVTIGGDRFTRSAVALQFEPPSLDLGIRRAKRAEVDARWRYATAKREAVERTLTQAARNARLALDAAKLELRLQQQEVALRSRALDLCVADERSAKGTSDAVASARLELAAARTDEARAMATVVVRDAEWQRLTGRLIDRDRSPLLPNGSIRP